MPTSRIECDRAPSSSKDSSFVQEITTLLGRRLILIFSIGLGISIIAYLTVLYGPQSPHFLHTFLVPYIGYLLIGHIVSFAVGIALVWFIPPTAGRLHAIEFFFLGYHIVCILFAYAMLQPQILPVMPIALILLLRAALLPCGISIQVSLSLLALMSYLSFNLYSNTYVAQVHSFWLARGDFTANLFNNGMDLFILGTVSIIISVALYNMRKSLFEAKQMGNYKIEKELGSGGMGKVYKANHVMICRPAALKVLQGGGDQDYFASVARFEREVRLSATLTHPNTITIFDYGRTTDNTFYYVMEYLEGMDLQKLVEKYGPLSPERTAFIIYQACGSLAEAHSRNIIHRDIKPSNIFLTHRGGIFDFVKVLDFGLARKTKLGKDSSITQTGAFYGTPTYVSPESISGTQKVDGRSDIYNLGAVIYWMLTGSPPFDSGSSIETLVDHLKTVPKKPSEVTELTIPKELDDLVMKCLEKKPEDRFQNLKEFHAALIAIKFENPWTQEKADEWWKLHMPSQETMEVSTKKDETLSREIKGASEIHA